MFPERFCSMTNGITPRRWLAYANQGLAALIDDRIGRAGAPTLNQLQQLRAHTDDRDFVEAFATVKRGNKRRLIQYCRDTLGVELNPDSMFDVQIKRMHEYKRQLLNVMHVIWRYQAILARPDAGWTPRTVLFAGKAASAYGIAKLIIKLINDVAVKVNNDPRVGDLLKVVFVLRRLDCRDDRSSRTDLSEQISTAGTEASGTGNMKLALNGALTIGTLDGANIEIRDQVGDGLSSSSGLNAADVSLACGSMATQHPGQAGSRTCPGVDTLTGSLFCPDEPGRFLPLHDQLLRHGDRYLLLADFRAYIDCQRRVDQAFASPTDWTRSAILNVAGMGVFSSDRTIAEYASRIWGVRPLAWSN
ncbi:MAG: glycogen/starch/alpha-glucan phosphorylase [Burkholderiaceae bacterium]